METLSPTGGQRGDDRDTREGWRAGPCVPKSSRAVYLRDYQLDVIERVAATVEAGQRRVCIVAPTGAGKTVIAAEKVRRAVERGQRALFLAHRRELISQTANKLHDAGLDPGVILAGVEPRPGQRVQVASISTLWARAWRGTRLAKPPADLLIVDEAHHVRARTYQQILADYGEAEVIGLTATPCRGDGKGLGNSFDALVECPDVQGLIDLGFLVPTKVYAPAAPDLRGVGTARGDYVEAQLARAVDQPKLVGDIVEHWHRLGENRKTVVFATGVGHSIHIRDEFRRSGVLAEHIDGTTLADERDAILRRLSRGEVDVVSNCMVLTEGWDQPDVSCAILARPTKHHGLYRQMVGRVLRPAPGKVNALVLDHAGATLHHGFVEEPVIWTLDQDRRAELPAQDARAKHEAPGLATCPECSAIRRQGQPCPACGWRPTPMPRHVAVADGELAHVARDGRMTVPVQDKIKFFSELIWIAQERGYRPGWAAHKFKEKFGHWPPRGTDPEPVPPDPATRSWVRSRQIAFARARAAA